jgi:hypothetical protein
MANSQQKLRQFVQMLDRSVGGEQNGIRALGHVLIIPSCCVQRR